jgi:DNA polymerase I-like protein with 3'-5' exonuclease and polymerase domains
VWASKKPKVLHHEKFDRQGIVHRYGLELENVVWDTMGGEHLLEEDKKGAYGLKILTRSRLPEYAGYEDKVAELREAHGGGTRAEEAKRYRKATITYEKSYTEYVKALNQFELEVGPYHAAVAEWEAKKKAEQDRAKAARKAKETDPALRKQRPDVYGPKPRKPKKPKEPKKPVHQEPFDFTKIPLEDLELYASVDADVTRQHAVHQHQRMAAEHKRDVAACERNRQAPPLAFQRLMAKHVIPTSRTLADMEFTGFPVDLPYLEDLDKKLEAKVDEAQSRLYTLAGGPFTIDNPAALGKLMFTTGFLQDGKTVVVPLDDNIKRTSRGQTKSDESTLKYIANTYGFELPKVVLQYRKARKARAPFLINVREHARFDRRMHSTFHLVGTGTGRLSSSNENLQNVPKKLAGFNIKKIFIPPPGYTLINTDAKGAEIRIFATYSHDEKLIKAILDGLDTHSFFTSKVFGVDYDEVEKARELCDRFYAGEAIAEEIVRTAEALVKKRTNCKRVVFGTLYGAMAAKIAETAGISLTEAQEVIDLMFKMFPSIPAYIEATQNEVRLYGWVATLTGRKRRFPLTQIRMFRNRCFRQAVNFKIQSTSSDIVLWVLNQIHPVIKHDLRGQFHATVHDSIVFSVPHAYVPQIKDLMYEYGTRQAQIEFPWLSVPFLWDVEAGPSYGEVTDVNKYLQGQHYHEQIKAPEEVITDEEIRDEINQSLAN